MSDRSFWRHRMQFLRQDVSGINPITFRPTMISMEVLNNEPCDLEVVTKRIGQQGPQGMIYNNVETIRCNL